MIFIRSSNDEGKNGFRKLASPRCPIVTEFIESNSIAPVSATIFIELRFYRSSAPFNLSPIIRCIVPQYALDGFTSRAFSRREHPPSTAVTGMWMRLYKIPVWVQYVFFDSNFRSRLVLQKQQFIPLSFIQQDNDSSINRREPDEFVFCFVIQSVYRQCKPENVRKFDVISKFLRKIGDGLRNFQCFKRFSYT